jgi:tRNA uridine 5-carbamoylmethylation protein Kti12
MQLINLYAGPGAGKSTTAAGLFHIMKLSGMSCELVTEYAKDLVWSKRENMFVNQDYIFAKQRHKIDRLLEHDIDYVITDSPLALSLVYAKSMPKSFHVFVEEMVNTYDNVNFFLNRTKAYSEVGRNQTEAEAKELDVKVKKMLYDTNQYFTEISGDSDAPYKILRMLG